MNPFTPEKILGHLPILGQYVSGESYAPIQVEIDLTNACTSACPWCAGYKEREDNPFILFGEGETKADQWETSRSKTTELLHELSGYGVKSMTWTGGGDPSVHPFLSELIQCSDSCGMDNGLITNGVIEVTECLPSCDWVRFSVDAATEDGYARQHGKRQHFQRVIENIMAAVRFKEREGLNATIGVAFLTSQEMLCEVEPFVELWQDVAVDYIQFRPLLDTHGRIFFDDDARTMEVLQSASAMDSRVVTSEAKYQGLSGTGKTKQCHGAFLETAIASDGCVYACCHLKGNPKYSLGSLHEESFRTIWERHLSNRTFNVTDDCVGWCRHFGTNCFFENHVFVDRQHPNFI